MVFTRNFDSSDESSDEESRPKRFCWRLDSERNPIVEKSTITPKMTPKRKRVIFADERSKNLVQIHYLWDWRIYRETRKGQWMRLAQRRMDFRYRIEQLSKILSPILEKKYSEMVLCLND